MQQLYQTSDLYDLLGHLGLIISAGKQFWDNNGHDQSDFFASRFESVFVGLDQLLHLQTVESVEILDDGHVLLGHNPQEDILDDVLDALVVGGRGLFRGLGCCCKFEVETCG